MPDGKWNTVDGQTVHQADAVFEGGGVKGVALVGALEGFADYGYTSWLNVAGTSAGAILASFLAVGHTLADAKKVIANAPYQSFEDWGMGGPVIGGGLDLIRYQGLCRGQAFHDWMNKQLGGARFADVRDESGKSRLRMIATDITRQRMLVLPDDLADYLNPTTNQPIQPDQFLIADAVRMSMSIPYFFSPVHMTAAADRRQCLIVDGGVLSNFPVWIFDAPKEEAPKRPTFGFKITGGRGVGGGLERVIAHLGWPVDMGTRIFHTATSAWDERFASHSTVVRTCPVPAGDLGTTDFASVGQLKQTVMAEAKIAAEAFLDEFDLADYRNTFGKTITLG